MNNSGQCVEVMTSRWLSGVKAEMFTRVLQLQLGSGWFPVPDGIAKLHVAHGERFRLWIAPDKNSYTSEDLQRLCDNRNLGTLMLRINGVERGIIL